MYQSSNRGQNIGVESITHPKKISMNLCGI